MIYSGNIKIEDNKIIFVYHELSKPRFNPNIYKFGNEHDEIIKKEWEEHLASKREAKVSNVLYYDKKGEIEIAISFEKREKPIFVKHNQPCEAEVEDGKAMITKIL